MALKMNAIMLVMGFAIATLVSVASAISGTATYYTVYVPSACYGYEEQGTMIAAASDAIWDNGGACGRMYRITCTSGTNAGVAEPCKGGSVTVKIVDRCPSPGCQSTIDLSQQAFSVIANPDAGKINIVYTQSGVMKRQVPTTMLMHTHASLAYDL
ncbi:EG45-like domain containing protein [Senna tora]|uniref:EG45-like domain containing protein n=1 Tax=Senna tora TaxID=362788 RepID=A0A834X5A4_9FABA|nr:EG45-like domain containing protein [Senna tora]